MLRDKKIRTKYSPEFKVTVIMDMRKNNLSYRGAMRKYFPDLQPKHLNLLKNGNGGFDFDYNLIIPTPPEGEKYKADIIKQRFLLAFQDCVNGTMYSAPQDSTSAITIKLKDKKNSTVLHSFDFAIIYYDNDKVENGYLFLKNQKSQNTYIFEARNLSRNLDYKIEYILNFKDGWNLIREEYLNLKNINNDNNKHSFSLYLEAVNNIYNQLPDNIDEDEEDDYYD